MVTVFAHLLVLLVVKKLFLINSAFALVWF